MISSCLKIIDYIVQEVNPWMPPLFLEKNTKNMIQEFTLEVYILEGK